MPSLPLTSARSIRAFGPDRRLRSLPIWVGFFAAMFVLTGHTAAQTPNPYTLDQIGALIHGGVPEARVLELVVEHCIDFDLDQQTARYLQSLGARPALLGELAMVCRVTSTEAAMRRAQRAPATPLSADSNPSTNRKPRNAAWGRFGHIAASAVLAAESPESPMLGAELAIGVGSRTLGVRGSAGFMGILHTDTLLTHNRREPADLWAAGYAAADLVLLPGWDIYLLAGAAALSTGDIIPRLGMGFRLPSEKPDGVVLEIRAQQGQPRFWAEEEAWIDGAVLSISFGLGGRSFRGPE